MLYFSHSTPSLTKVIPAMDLIDKHLATAALNNTYEPSIKAALAIGKNVLNNYYNMTDHSELYCISMGICYEFHQFSGPFFSFHVSYSLFSLFHIYCFTLTDAAPRRLRSSTYSMISVKHMQLVGNTTTSLQPRHVQPFTIYYLNT